MSARSRRALANLEKRIQKFIDTAFFWPVEVGKILMRLLIVILNKLVRIISRRNRLVSKIALGDHLVGWSSIRGSIFRRIGYDQGGYSLFLTRARARGVRGYFWDSGSFRRRAGCGRRFCDFRKRFIFARIEKVSIPLYAGGRPVLRNICKIAKFVDTAENESKEAFLIWNVSMTPYGATWTHMGPHGSSLFYRFYVGSECGLRSNCLRKTGLPCFYDLSYERAGSPDFIDFSKFSKRGKML